MWRLSKLNPQSSNKILSRWLFSLCFLIAVMVIFGGFVRLTRSGLSIVEWQVISGVVPPIGEAAWRATFARYQQTPEYRQINRQMTLPEYKSIYFIEYGHRLLGRLAGLILVIPLMIFLATKTIPPREAPIYLGLGLLFALQGAMGWYMVKSGLIDQPQVSHYRLAAHLLLALILFTLCFWLGLSKTEAISRPEQIPGRATLLTLSFGLLVAIVLQIIYGAFMAGLKAGYVSNTFPLLFGYWLPPGLLSTLQPWPLNLVANPVTVHFLHRWFAFVILVLIGMLYYLVRKRMFDRKVQMSVVALIGLGGMQVLLGLGVIIWHVPLFLALAHQAVALGIFALALFVNYQLLYR